MKRNKWLLAFGLAIVIGLGAPNLRAASIIDEWANVKAPPAPELKPVTIDTKATALMIVDVLKETCNSQRYTRCPAMLPTLKKLLTEARANGMMVVYTSFANFPETDIIADIAPIGTDQFVHSFLDKFLNTDLEKILKDHGITTLLVTGLASNGGILETSSEAALKGFKVIVALDATTALTTYAEQLTAWQLANAPIISPNITLTKSDIIKF